MSGIAGYLGTQQAPAILQAMVGKMMHRGPDGQGLHIENPVFMGVRRMAAMGTGDVAEQPVYSPDRKLAIICDGEIYNYREERAELERRGMAFQTNCDAEVILRLYEVYGTNCVNRLNGVFTFAIHDMNKDLVFIARGPMGVKPLYYTTTQSGTFVFASEIKALFEHPSVQTEPDMVGIDAYLSLGYSPGPDAMFKGIHKLPPGHRLIWNAGLHVMIEPYWQWESYATPDPVLKTDEDFQARFDTLLEEAVKRRMAGSAPCGAFLTGSLESVAIVAAMAKDGGAPIRTFSTSAGGDRDGLPPSRDVAARLGCHHEEMPFVPHDMDKLPELIWALDEPVADISIAPMYILSRLASKHVKAVLAGAGTNEVFANRPAHDAMLLAHKRPKSFYKMMEALMPALPQASLARKHGFYGRIGPRTKQRIRDFFDAMQEDSLFRQQVMLTSVFDAREKIPLYAPGFAPSAGTYVDCKKDPPGWPTTMATLMAMQRDAALPDGVLAPFDKMTMFSSISGRLPFMDTRLMEFVLGAPDHLRRSHGKGKVMVRNYVEKALPGLLLKSAPPAQKGEGKKSMLEECLAANPLKEMVEVCLSEASVRRRELFEPKAVRELLVGARTGEIVYLKQVFSLLTLELWFRIFIDHEKGWISR
jgi:asparagine synthase (glutamine-hydrolysing)